MSHAAPPPSATLKGGASKLPPWKTPKSSVEPPVLKLFNTLTRKKEVFTPAHGRHVTWYNCGPTVYDSAHIGHARLYMSIDIMRRVLEDYFGYNVHMLMNITDIDDKIILRARHQYLFAQFADERKARGKGLTREVHTEVLEYWKNHTARVFGDAAAADWPKFFAMAKDQKTGVLETDYKFNLKLTQAATAYDALHAHAVPGDEAALAAVLEASRDILSPALDAVLGHTVTDQLVFRNLASFWEADFMSDMEALGIRPVDVLTRVSEYVPEIVAFVQQIIDNGYAYEADGSVYFDTRAFHANPTHTYAKLEPWSVNSEALLADGEGDLSTNLTRQKKSPADFALWKASKPGEPAWPSPWGPGRPGWHIECSVMASAIVGDKLDIHTGGEDLAFPHHDNEIAQSEAHFGCDQWVNYFMHVGHLHVEGQKMSKSLKNFTSVKEALAQLKASTLRMIYLQQHWINTMDFKPAATNEAVNAELTFKNFANNVKALIADVAANPLPFTGANDYRAGLEDTLMQQLREAQDKVHASLCDNIHTPSAIAALLDIVSKTNIYTQAVEARKLSPNPYLLGKVARYVTRMTKVFGLTEPGEEIGYGFAADNAAGAASSGDVMPYLQVLSKFRDEVRATARNAATDAPALSRSLLEQCDTLRDVHLAELGVVLDDRDAGRALVKLVDPAVLRAEREKKVKREEAKRIAKVEQARKQAVKALERLYKGREAPSAMFREGGSAAGDYGQWDADGVPTHTAAGEELPKSRRKKVLKEFETQKKIHDEYRAATAAGAIDWEPLRVELSAAGKTLNL
ncbi:tRNA synthetases class I (C) catalytic domain-containing protein [Blastocladiella britannica]|nr:tRNA synthetases class I (C) catalytic domain-containing protein [Blastocladiella britannica]